MTVCFDLDGTLCTNTYGAYDEAEPFPWAIERLNALAEAGHRIVVFTARGTATGIDWREVTQNQLDRWGVRYDDLQLGKPSAAVYVDDRAVHTTAWREGDAYAVPGFGLPAPADRPEELPGVLAHQRTTIVESGRTYGGRPFLAADHVARVRALAAGAGLQAPSAEDVTAALDRALAGAPADVVFSIALHGPVDPAFLDVAAERVADPVITLRSVAQAAAGLEPFEAEVDGAPAYRVPAGGLGGRLAAVVDGVMHLAPVADPAPPLSRWLEERVEAAEPLTDDHLDRADEVFEAVSPFGLLRVVQVGDRQVGTGDDTRARLAEELGR